MMKRLIPSIALLFVAISVQAQEINWMSMNEALQAQKKEPKKIFMDAYTSWCGPCKLLDRNTFSNKDVANYINENYYAVKFDAEGQEEILYQDQVFSNPNFDPSRKGRNSQHQFASALKISGYPTMVFFDEEGNVLLPLTGYKTPKQLEIYLKLFAKDDYKKIASNEDWVEYEKNFEGEF